MDKFIFTCGDINGIGPEIVIKTLNKIVGIEDNKFFFICPSNVFEETSQIVNPGFRFEVIKGKNNFSGSPSSNDTVTIINTGKVKINTGEVTKEAGNASFKAIKLAFDMVINKKADAMITSPISKFAIKKAGYKFPGHTEMLAEWSGIKHYVMMFLSQRMNAALMTIHEPLKRVPSLITKNNILHKFEIIIQSLQKDLKIKDPKAAVLGLNPHAGENGNIGREEEKILKPAILSSRYAKYLDGPFSPDAFFAKKLYKKYDIVIGMYHDQVLIPFKLLNFASGVNYTAGLPIVRTSPDHGTAFDIAMQNKADISSIYEAYLYAQKIVNSRKSLFV